MLIPSQCEVAYTCSERPYWVSPTRRTCLASPALCRSPHGHNPRAENNRVDQVQYSPVRPRHAQRNHRIEHNCAGGKQPNPCGSLGCVCMGCVVERNPTNSYSKENVEGVWKAVECRHQQEHDGDRGWNQIRRAVTSSSILHSVAPCRKSSGNWLPYNGTNRTRGCISCFRRCGYRWAWTWKR